MKEHLIIDSDAHIRETEEDSTSRLPQELNRLRFSLFPSDNWDRFLGRLGKQVYDMHTYLHDLDTEGVDVAVLSPMRSLNTLEHLSLCARRRHWSRDLLRVTASIRRKRAFFSIESTSYADDNIGQFTRASGFDVATVAEMCDALVARCVMRAGAWL